LSSHERTLRGSFQSPAMSAVGLSPPALTRSRKPRESAFLLSLLFSFQRPNGPPAGSRPPAALGGDGKIMYPRAKVKQKKPRRAWSAPTARYLLPVRRCAASLA
jgi:hypothetical protein